jgi:hypothetical protein
MGPCGPGSSVVVAGISGRLDGVAVTVGTGACGVEGPAALGLAAWPLTDTQAYSIISKH